MAYPIHQASFASGELDPGLHARVDLARYYTGLARCRNFFVLPQGGARNRSGFRYIDTVYQDSPCRLIPFVYNPDQTYVLEFTDNLMRVYYQGALVLDGSSAFELATPYEEEELPRLSFRQVGDVMTIAHPNHAPRELSRADHDDWSLDVVTFGATIDPPSSGFDVAPEETAINPIRAYGWKVTSIDEEYNESEPSDIIHFDTLVGTVWGGMFLSADVRTEDPSGAVVEWSAVTGAIEYNVYRAVVYITKPASEFIYEVRTQYELVGRTPEPNFYDQNNAPQGVTPPVVADVLNAAGKYPAVVTTYQQRMIYANSDNAPETLWCSQSGVRKNFNSSMPPLDDQAIIATLASPQNNEVRAVLDLEGMVVITGGALWRVLGGQDDLITPSSFDPRVQTERGCSWVSPVVVGSRAIMIGPDDRTVRELAVGENGRYDAINISTVSQHLFDGYTLVDACYAESPYSIVWMVRSDGTLLGLSYDHHHSMLAWHRHDSAGGVIENVCAVPEGNESALYVCVRRTIDGATKRYVERLEPRNTDADIEESFFVDSGLSYDGTNTGSTTMTISGGTTWTQDEELEITTSAAYFGSADVLDEVHFPLDDRPYRFLITSFQNAYKVTVKAMQDLPAALQDTATVTWGHAQPLIAGLGHLEGETVAILGDGSTRPQQVVTSGQVALDPPAVVIHAGLPITAQFKTLPISSPQEPAASVIAKRVPRVWLSLHQSAGMTVGTDEESQYAPLARDVSDGYFGTPRLITDKEEVGMEDDWDLDGQVLVQQLEPLPVTVLAVTPDVQGGR